MSVNIENARRHVLLVPQRNTTEQRIKELSIALSQVLRELERLNTKVAKFEAKKGK